MSQYDYKSFSEENLTKAMDEKRNTHLFKISSADHVSSYGSKYKTRYLAIDKNKWNL